MRRASARALVWIAAALLLWPQISSANGLEVVTSREAFVSLIEGRELTRFGITLVVTPEGEIIGRAFGTDVTGDWDWQGEYFCRDLFYGERDLGPNCQQVSVQGESMRFTSDQGTGDFADFRLK